MSKTKYIRVGADGWIAVYDVLHDIFLKHLIDAAEDEFNEAGQPPLPLLPWLGAEVDSWRRCAAITDIAASFDDGWAEEQRRLVIDLAERACAALGALPSITAEEMSRWRVLEGIGIETRGETEIPTAPVIEVGRVVITLLRGEKIEPPPNGDWYYSVSGRYVWERYPAVSRRWW